MLQDRSLLQRFERRLRHTIALAERDAAQADGPHREIARWHAGFFAEMRGVLEDPCQGDLLAELARGHASGRIELATTCATHALLPAHQAHPATVRAQVGVGIDTFRDVFGFAPRFFWLPECAYYPGLEEILREAGIEAFALETHGVLKAQPPATDLRRPLQCPNGLRGMARDPELSRLVWSAHRGYPGDPSYREFHRDQVHALPEEEVARWLEGPGARIPSGLKYWRVTGPQEEKDWYDPAVAKRRVELHALDFVRHLTANESPGGLVFLPFDAELFGHWWFEGPLWLEQVFRHLAADPTGTVALATATRAITQYPAAHHARPAASSWGRGGDFSFWINHETAWIYPRLMQAAERFEGLLHHHDAAPPRSAIGRALRQAARTLLLAQSSDWPFLLTAKTSGEASREWMERLLERFEVLCQMLETGSIDEARLAQFASADAAFPELDLRHFRAR